MSYFNSAAKLSAGTAIGATLIIAARIAFAAAKPPTQRNLQHATTTDRVPEWENRLAALIGQLKDENLPVVTHTMKLTLKKHKIPCSPIQLFKMGEGIISHSFVNALDAFGERSIKIETLRHAAQANIDGELKKMVNSWNPVSPIQAALHL